MYCHIKGNLTMGILKKYLFCPKVAVSTGHHCQLLDLYQGRCRPSCMCGIIHLKCTGIHQISHQTLNYSVKGHYLYSESGNLRMGLASFLFAPSEYRYKSNMEKHTIDSLLKNACNKFKQICCQPYFGEVRFRERIVKIKVVFRQK